MYNFITLYQWISIPLQNYVIIGWKSGEHEEINIWCVAIIIYIKININFLTIWIFYFAWITTIFSPSHVRIIITYTPWEPVVAYTDNFIVFVNNTSTNLWWICVIIYFNSRSWLLLHMHTTYYYRWTDTVTAWFRSLSNLLWRLIIVIQLL